MRESFEHILGGYGESAKHMQEENTPEEEEGIETILDWEIEAAIKSRNSTEEAQRKIFGIQQIKQEIMGKLESRIAHLDDSGFIPERRPDEPVVTQIGGEFHVMGEAGAHDIAVTKGEMLTDMEWNKYYYLDPATVDRRVRKRYLIEDAKQELMNRLNEQIIIDETSSDATHWMKQDAYEQQEKKSGFETGFIAEKMVKNFLKKLSIDSGADFTVIDADIYQDIEQKIDFIIRRKRHVRGVGVEESEKVEHVGIQFTTNPDLEVLKHKQRQVKYAREHLKENDAVEDIILVTMPTQSVRDVYNVWRRDEKPGGPDKLWDMSVKKRIFQSVMQGIMTEDEIEEQWSAIAEEQL